MSSGRAEVPTQDRVLRCTLCDQDVNVHESPRAFIDPKLYVCLLCVGADQQSRETEPQLTFWQWSIVDDPLRKDLLRTEYRSYDPALAAIPY